MMVLDSRVAQRSTKCAGGTRSIETKTTIRHKESRHNAAARLYYQAVKVNLRSTREREREGREEGEEYTERVYALWQVALGVCFASSCLCSGARGQAIHSIALAMFTRQEQTWRPCSDVRFHLRRAICTFSPFPEGSSFHFFTLKPQVATQPRHNSSRKQSSRLRTA